jgi:hypothetical protein
MAAIEFERGDEVLSKLSGTSIMTVLAAEGMKVRCSDEQDRQYWFDMLLLQPAIGHNPATTPLGRTCSLRAFPGHIRTAIVT